MLQIKEQDINKAPEEQLREVGNGNLPEKEFKAVMIDKLVYKDEPRTWEKNGCAEQEVIRNFNEHKNIKNNQSWRNIITEMKNTLGEINNRINEAEEQISELEN